MLSEKERALVFKLAEELTGATQTGDSRQNSLVTNVERRIRDLGLTSLAEYLKHVEANPREHAQLLSALTIHTTSWFREHPHFVVFQELLLAAADRGEVFKLWCAACSTGEEVYSFGLMLEEFRRVHPAFDYRILGTDIDPTCVATAQRAIYPMKAMGFHVNRYRRHVLEGSGRSEGFFTLAKEVRERCTFKVHDVRAMVARNEGPFDLVVCRNVLIYFSADTVAKVVSNLLLNTKSDGHLMLGHSESVNASDFGITQTGHSVYSKRKAAARAGRRSTRYRVLTIDDSATMRKFMETTLTEQGFDSVTVGSGSEATMYLNFNDVDLITLDLNMPDIHGEKWLEIERREGLKTPVVVISDIHGADGSEVVRLLALGAQEYMEKDRLRQEPEKMKDVLLELIRAHSGAKVQPSPFASAGAFPVRRPELVLIGASTGGPQALVKLFAELPKSAPAIMITQHMSPKFTQPFAERLAEVSGLPLGNVEDMAPVEPGHIYLAYGDYHIGVEEHDGGFKVRTSYAAPFNGHRPSVDYMFNSVLGIQSPMMAILLTGMGRDGALGLRFLRKEGVFCIAQSEEDCIVYGMPKEAIERDAADYVGTIDEIRRLMLDSFYLKRAA